jgi:hypothetical protein
MYEWYGNIQRNLCCDLPCILVGAYQHFGETYCLHLQGTPKENTAPKSSYLADRCQVLLPSVRITWSSPLLPQNITICEFRWCISSYLLSNTRHYKPLFWENREGRWRTRFPPPTRFFLPHQLQPAACRFVLEPNAISFRVSGSVRSSRCDKQRYAMLSTYR